MGAHRLSRPRRRHVPVEAALRAVRAELRLRRFDEKLYFFDLSQPANSRQIQVQQAAQGGAQYAAFHPWNDNSAAAIANVVTSAGDLPGIAASSAPAEFCGCPTGKSVTAFACNSTCPDGQTAGY